MKEFEIEQIQPTLAQPEVSSIGSLPTCSSDAPDEVEVVLCNHPCCDTTSEISQQTDPNILARSERNDGLGENISRRHFMHS